LSRKIAVCGVLAALGVAFSYAESLFAPPMPVPGIKLGLANIIVLMALYLLGIRGAAVVAALRIMLSTLLFAGGAAFLFSAGGGLLSLLVMTALKKSRLCSVAGVSVGGAIAHNLGQLAVAALVMESVNVFWYLPVLTVTAAASGFVTGLCASLLLRRLEKVKPGR
jgi:heptaprenyl diphosphate synthase